MGKAGMTQRRAERILAFQVLYGLHFTSVTNLGELRALFDETPMPDDADEAEDSGQPAFSPEDEHAFAWRLVEGCWTHGDRLDELVGRFSKNWRVDRMGRIELTLLRLAMFELAYCPDVPAKVVINEALELTARFGDGKAKSFINGILDSAAKAAESGALAPHTNE